MADNKCLYSVERENIKILGAAKMVTKSSLDLFKNNFELGDLVWLTLAMWLTSALIFRR